MSEAEAIPEAGRPAGVWEWLALGLDFARHVPRPIPEAEVHHVAGPGGADSYVLKNPRRHTYLKLSPEDHFLWTRMDGQRTVKDLLMEYFKRYKSFAFGRVRDLVTELKDAGFLEGAAPKLLQRLRHYYTSRTLTYRVTRLVATLLEREFALKEIDRWVSAVYGRVVWALFTRAARAVYLLVSLAGLAAFLALLFTTGGQFSVIETRG
jgi:hypothetical protein